MPLKSQAQRAWMHIHHPKMADRWEKHTPKGKKLPKHVGEGFEPDDIDGEGFENTGDIPENPDLPQPREEGEEYEKTAPTWALKMDEPFSVETIEGPMDGKEGDYLAQGPEGDMWVVDGEVFNKTYEPMDNHIGRYDPAWLESDHDEPKQELEVDDGPAMESVFRVREDLQDLSSTKPPPGSKPLKAGELNTLGQTGQSAQKGLDALKQAGQDVDAFKTPDGQFMAYPKMGGPASTPLRADMTKGGLWSPVTGSTSGSLTHPLTTPS